MLFLFLFFFNILLLAIIHCVTIGNYTSRLNKGFQWDQTAYDFKRIQIIFLLKFRILMFQGVNRILYFSVLGLGLGLVSLD